MLCAMSRNYFVFVLFTLLLYILILYYKTKTLIKFVALEFNYNIELRSIVCHLVYVRIYYIKVRAVMYLHTIVVPHHTHHTLNTTHDLYSLYEQ